MAADRSNRDVSATERQQQTSPSSRASGAPAQEAGRPADEPGTRDREQRIATSRDAADARGRGSADENARIARTIHDLWNRRDFDQALRFAAEDVECVQVPFNATYRGRDGYRQFMQGWVNAFPDAQVEVRRVTAGEDGAAVEFVGRGTHTGPLTTPGGTIPATGRRGELALCEVLEIEQGQVRRVRSYFDSATLLRQLGVLADDGAPGQGATSSAHPG
jgi:steroid delta-isomerase-like uncharacterized protein